MAGSFAGNDSRPLGRNCGFANSQPSSAQCATMRDRHADHSDFARLLFATKSRAGAMQSWTENLNLSLTTTMNEV